MTEHQQEESRAYEALLDAVNMAAFHDKERLQKEYESVQHHVGDILRQDDFAVIDDSIVIDPNFHSASADFVIGGEVVTVSI